MNLFKHIERVGGSYQVGSTVKYPSPCCLQKRITFSGFSFLKTLRNQPMPNWFPFPERSAIQMMFPWTPPFSHGIFPHFFGAPHRTARHFWYLRSPLVRFGEASMVRRHAPVKNDKLFDAKETQPLEEKETETRGFMKRDWTRKILDWSNIIVI